MRIVSLIAVTVWIAAAAFGQNKTLRVGVAGSEPFVVKEKSGALTGVSVEIWQAVAARAGWKFEWRKFDNVPDAIDKLAAGELDAVVGPVSITAERAEHVRFTQPYFQSSLSILSRTDSPSTWQRISPFFSREFFTAAGLLLLVLAAVGTLIWMTERNSDTFPKGTKHGVANGIWFAIVTMSTVGYGDLAPKTFLGRLVTGVWIIVSVIAATSLVAGIASTLTLTGLSTTVISSAEQISGRKVAVLRHSPGEEFAQRYRGEITEVASLEEAYNLLKKQQVDAVIFDRPQLRYYLNEQHDKGLAVSSAEYMRQNYGFAMGLTSQRVHPLNVTLLQLQESGRVDRIVREWLGSDQD